MELSRREFLKSSALVLAALPNNKNLSLQGDITTRDKLETIHAFILEREKHQKHRKFYLQNNSPDFFTEREPEWTYNFYCTEFGNEITKASIDDTIKFRNMHNEKFTYFQAEARILYHPNNQIERSIGMGIYNINVDNIKRKEIFFQSFLDTPINKEPCFPEIAWEISDRQVNILKKEDISPELIRKHKLALDTIHENITKKYIRYIE